MKTLKELQENLTITNAGRGGYNITFKKRKGYSTNSQAVDRINSDLKPKEQGERGYTEKQAYIALYNSLSRN